MLTLHDAFVPRGRELGLLELPEEVLHLILCFLGTLELAAARLACRALRDASRHGQTRVLFQEWAEEAPYKATICASPTVLQALRSLQISWDCINEEHRRANPFMVNIMDWSMRPHPYMTADQQIQALAMQLLVKVAQNVQSLTINSSSFGPPLQMSWRTVSPQLTVAQMPRLERLHLHGPLPRAVLQQLTALGHLTCLGMTSPCSIADLQELCSTLSLSCLDLGCFFAGEEASHD